MWGKRQGDEWRKPCISKMPGRRQNMPPEGPKCTSKKSIPGRPPLSIMYVKHARATAKLKLNGVKQVCLTCQANVNMQPAGQKCQVKHGRETNGVSHVYQTCQADVYLSIYLSI